MCVRGLQSELRIHILNDSNVSNLNLYQTNFIYEYDTSQYVLSKAMCKTSAQYREKFVLKISVNW